MYFLILAISTTPLKSINNNKYKLEFNSNINNKQVYCLEVYHKWPNKCKHKEHISHKCNINSNNNSNSNSTEADIVILVM